MVLCFACCRVMELVGEEGADLELSACCSSREPEFCPSTHTLGLTDTHNSSSRGSGALPWTLLAPIHVAHIHTKLKVNK